jgi:hypothetical protein
MGGNMRPKYVAAILRDMIGGMDVRFPIERYSVRAAVPLVESVWRVARELIVTAFEDEHHPTGPRCRANRWDGSRESSRTGTLPGSWRDYRRLNVGKGNRGAASIGDDLPFCYQ